MRKRPRKRIPNIRTAFIPHLTVYDGNPYWDLLAESLSTLEIKILDQPDPFNLQWRWLVKNRNNLDVLHFHFLKPAYSAGIGSASMSRLARFMLKTALARILGFRIVWTVHNLNPHERLEPEWVGRLAAKWMAIIANDLIVHCMEAERIVREAINPRAGLHVIHHPPYHDAYPDLVSKQEARRHFHLAERDRVLLYLGTVRPYKGIEELIKSFKSLEETNLRLILAGKVWDEEYANFLRRLIGADGRISTYFEFIPDTNLQYFFGAADIVILPFVEVLSSGSALLALTFGCPVVAPNRGCISEILGDAGIVYEPNDPLGLISAIKFALCQDLRVLNAAAKLQAQRWSWGQMARETEAVYRGAKSPSTRSSIP